MKKIMLHSGITPSGWIHYTDDKDALPPDIKDYSTVEFNGEYTALLSLAMSGEKFGLKYVIQIGDLYYETPEA
jgi:hypothetical protein